MHFDTDGVYTLLYTAEDNCGNTTVEERTVEVLPPPRTVLYEDGTFIINEQGRNRATYEALHGTVLFECSPLDPNGATDAEKYIFQNSTSLPWVAHRTNIKNVYFDEPVYPQDMSYWFYTCHNLVSIDTTNLHTDNVVAFQYTFYETCQRQDNVVFDLSDWNFANTVSMESMFDRSNATQVLFGSLNAPKLESMSHTLDSSYIQSLTIDFSATPVLNTINAFANGCVNLRSIEILNWDTSSCEDFMWAFSNDSVLESIDISGLDVSSATTVDRMFINDSHLVTIYADGSFAVPASATGDMMFYGCTSLVGGAGTAYNVNFTDKTRARIDQAGRPGYFTAKA